MIVERSINGKTVRYLEYFAPYKESDAEQDYVMADAAVSVTYPSPQTDIPGKDVFASKQIVVMADGYF